VGCAEAVTKLFDLRDLPPGNSFVSAAAVRGRFGPLALEGFAHRAPTAACAPGEPLPHRAQPVDVGDGRLFNSLGEIECHAHGARFDTRPAPAWRPLPGASLQPLRIEERDAAVWMAD